MTKLYVSLILLGLLLVVACTSPPTPTVIPTPVPTATPSPTATAVHTPTSINVAVPTSVPGGRVAADGDTVAVHYYGTLDTGEMFDSSREQEPLSFILGSGQMITGFDAAVHDMKVGDTKVVRLEPDEAYGEHSDDQIIEFPIDQMPEGLSKSDNVLFQNGAQGVILEITDEVFRVDANHRLAGQALTFEIELISIQ